MLGILSLMIRMIAGYRLLMPTGKQSRGWYVQIRMLGHNENNIMKLMWIDEARLRDNAIYQISQSLGQD